MNLNFAGNAWSWYHSDVYSLCCLFANFFPKNGILNRGCTEQNKYILLHKFHCLKYICPDKNFGKKVKQEPHDDDHWQEGTKTTTKGTTSIHKKKYQELIHAMQCGGPHLQVSYHTLDSISCITKAIAQEYT